jgi:hypothetical protein
VSLREKLGYSTTDKPDRQRQLFEGYGVLENPFPPASQPMGHPHKETPSDEELVRRLRTFLDDRATQVVVVAGTQGLGKTNLLEYYKDELSELFRDTAGYYIIRYYPDPEPDFGSVVRRIVQEFGISHIQSIGKILAGLTGSKGELEQVLSAVRGHETRQAFIHLAQSAQSEEALERTSKLLLDYLLGLRVYKRHTEGLGVQFRLDTTESMTQALHDLVYLSRRLGCLEAIFLFMDELEKQGGLPPLATTRYLSAIRALIDALPHNLFLVLAMTPEALSRYRRTLPALAGRLQSVISLSPLSSVDQALELARFYVEQKRKAAKNSPAAVRWVSGSRMPIDDRQVASVFQALKQEAEATGQEGVTPRAFLDRLHNMTEVSLLTPLQ